MSFLTKNYVIIPIILSIALFSRLYLLSDFPYFIPGYPWEGVGSGELKGLYSDEYGYYGMATNLIKNPSIPTLYQPWLQLLSIGASVSILGSNPFAVRLPSAIFSSISVVLVYLICIKKFKSKLAACLSSLYLIAMTPALVLNRMAFLENGAVLFFLASYLCLLKYSERIKGKYLLLSIVLAGLSVLTKIEGLIAPIFILLYLAHMKALTKNIRYIILISAVTLIFPIIASITHSLDYLQLISQFLKQWQIGKIGHEFSTWSYLLFNSMPSGYVTRWGDYPRLEYWYLFSYFALAYVAASELDKVFDPIVVIASFLCLFFMVGGLGVYYLTIIQPFLAIPVGYAIVKLTRMSTPLATFFYLFMYAPTALSVDIYLSMSDKSGIPILRDPVLTLLKLTNIIFPLLLIAIIPLLRQRLQENFRSIINTTLIVVFFIFLFTGSYLLPVFYPHYLTPKPM